MKCPDCQVTTYSDSDEVRCYSCSHKHTIQEIADKFRGIRVDELEEMNPSYSCVICGNKECEFHNRPNCACVEHVTITELEWLMFYDFEKESK